MHRKIGFRILSVYEKLVTENLFSLFQKTTFHSILRRFKKHKVTSNLMQTFPRGPEGGNFFSKFFNAVLNFFSLFNSTIF